MADAPVGGTSASMISESAPPPLELSVTNNHIGLTAESIKNSKAQGTGSAKRSDEAISDNFVLLLKPSVAGNISEKISMKANPTGLVMESWKVLESTLRDLAAKSMPPNVMLSRKIGILQIFDLLTRHGVTSVAENDTLRRMLAMRNLAAHADETISDDSAKRFQEIAESLTNNYRDKLVTTSSLQAAPNIATS